MLRLSPVSHQRRHISEAATIHTVVLCLQSGTKTFLLPHKSSHNEARMKTKTKRHLKDLIGHPIYLKGYCQSNPSQTRAWRRHEKLYAQYSSPIVTRASKSRRMRWAGP